MSTVRAGARPGKEIILFDLDGTLTDPGPGITRSVQYSLRAFGIQVANTDELATFIGPPLRDSYKKYYAFTDEETEKAIEKYREYFEQRGIFENTLYQGIAGLLKDQLQRGRTLAVATSKPTVYAQQILEHFAIAGCFAFVAGSELDGRRSQKSQVIRYALDHLGAATAGTAIMVGDREHDILGAKALEMESIGVLYGYGSQRELSQAGATHLARDVNELGRLLKQL